MNCSFALVKTVIAFVLQLKVDKLKLIELCGTSESEFSSVSAVSVSLVNAR